MLVADEQQIVPDYYRGGAAPLPPSLLDSMGAAASQAWNTNPATLLTRRFARDLRGDANLSFVPPDQLTDEDRAETAERLTPEQANAEFGIEGHLKFDQPILRSNARDLRDLKRAELDRADVLNRAEAGLIGTPARFIAGFAASAVDPLNIASAFIPVVGPARYASMLAAAGTAGGRAMVRVGAGALEGAVGAAVLEPLVYTLARSEQQDYDAMNSLLNIAFGTALGGGLHVIGGAVRDRVTGEYRNQVVAAHDSLPAADRESITRAAIAQMASNEPVNVAPLLRSLKGDLLSGTTLGRGAEGLEAAMRGAERDPDFAPAMPPERRSTVRTPALDAKGEPIVAYSRKEEEAIRERLAQEGVEVEFVRREGGGADAVRVEKIDAEVYRDAAGLPRVYESVSRAKEAADQIGGRWVPVPLESEGGVVLMRGANTQQTRLLSQDRRGVEVPPDALRPVSDFKPPMSSSAFGAMLREITRPIAEARFAGESTLRAAPAVKPPDAPNAPATATTQAGRDLAHLQAEIERNDALLGREPAPPGVVDPLMKQAEDRAKGFEAAAACLVGKPA